MEILVLANYRISDRRVISGKDSLENWITFSKKNDNFLKEEDVKDFNLLTTVSFQDATLVNERFQEYSYSEAKVIKTNSLTSATANLDYPYDLFGKENSLSYELLEKISVPICFVKVNILKIYHKKYEGYGFKLNASFYYDGVFYEDFSVNDINTLEYFSQKHPCYVSLHKEAYVAVTFNQARVDFATKVISGIVLK